MAEGKYFRAIFKRPEDKIYWSLEEDLSLSDLVALLNMFITHTTNTELELKILNIRSKEKEVKHGRIGNMGAKA